MKRLLFFLFAALSTSVFATPDYERTITEIVLGMNNDGLVIYQEVRDTTLPGEAYILVKDIVDKQLVIKQKIEVKSAMDIQKFIQSKDFRLVLPELVQEKYLQLFGGKRNIYYFGSTFFVYDIMPKELWSFHVDKIEGIISYKEYDLIILLLVSQNETEQIRKVLILKPPKEG
jgi:hypothetical protein